MCACVRACMHACARALARVCVCVYSPDCSPRPWGTAEPVASSPCWPPCCWPLPTCRTCVRTETCCPPRHPPATTQHSYGTTHSAQDGSAQCTTTQLALNVSSSGGKICREQRCRTRKKKREHVSLQTIEITDTNNFKKIAPPLPPPESSV